MREEGDEGRRQGEENKLRSEHRRKRWDFYWEKVDWTDGKDLCLSGCEWQCN